MNRRFLELTGVGAVLMAVLALLNLAPIPVAGQAPAASAKPGEAARPGPVPKTAWGEPDLQGIWTDELETPVQRPAQYANKEVFTDVERAELDKIRGGVLRRDTRAPKGSERDVAGAYNAVFQSIKPTGRRTSLVVDPPNGRIPAFTPEVRKRFDALLEFQMALLQNTGTCKDSLPGCAGGKYGPPSPRREEAAAPYYSTGRFNRNDNPEDRNVSARCMSAVLPDFSGYRRIVQSPGSVSVFYDVGQGQGWQRVIPVSGSPHLPPSVRQRFGDSRGRWEGNTLVVDTTNFSPKSDFRGARENLHLVERWVRADANTLEYSVTIEDPTTWTRPWTVKQEMTRQDEQANRIYYEPRCHEGNYAMVSMLAGGRAVDKAFAEGRGPHPATIDTDTGDFGASEENGGLDPLEGGGLPGRPAELQPIRPGR